ncbi:MAG: NADH-quinone oxidoreductase subunit NuoE [Desulfobacterales bacterium]|jgi:NADH-quinone oxidoreductase subunit E
MDKELSAEEKSLLEQIKADLVEIGNDRSKLIPILQLVQQKFAYLPGEAIHLVADHFDISSSEVYGVATFYNQFRFNPPGKNPVKVCLGTACHVKGGDIILENFERKLEIKEGQTTPDREFSVDRVACVGCCALAPVVVLGEAVHGHMQPSKVEGLVLRTRIEKEMLEREKQKNESTE